MLGLVWHCLNDVQMVQQNGSMRVSIMGGGSGALQIDFTLSFASSEEGS